MGKLIGILFGLIISAVTAWMFERMAGIMAGGITSFWGESWLYISVTIPFAIVFGILGGYFQKHRELSNKKLWQIGIGSAFFITLYSGTIGAIIGEALIRGSMETMNVEGTLVWGTIYAFVLLPVTVPFARFVIDIFYKLIKKITPVP
ncbi:hypothetical protein [Sporosarcina ureae]|uniref:hypothetical protein n=1 Tax=Sporosarcina ureae TaxID=1571 RepID=UPI0026F372D2|nr:hypothetical protein [Sporosarcina ureae]